MSDYSLYIREKSISNRDMIQTIRDSYPAYSKIQQSMVCNSDKYAVQLIPEAETLLIEAYGEGAGLNICQGTAPSSKRRPEKRIKRNRLIVRLNDELYSNVRQLMAKLEYSSVQDFLEAALRSMVEQDKEAAQ